MQNKGMQLITVDGLCDLLLA